MPLTDDVLVRRRETKQANASAQRREQILDAAAEAFAEKGYNGSSIRDVAVRASLSHTGVLHHYPDKAAVLEAVLDRFIVRAGEEFNLDTADGAEFLRGLLKIAARDAQRGAGTAENRLFRIISAEALSPTHPAHGYMRRWYAEVRARATVALDDVANRGLLAIDTNQIPAAAAQIAGLREGLDPQWLLDPDAIDLVGTMRAQLQQYVTFEL